MTAAVLAGAGAAGAGPRSAIVTAAAGIGALPVQASGGGVLSADAVPLVAAAVAGLFALGAVVAAARSPGRRRLFAAGGVVIAAAVAAGNAGIAAEVPQSLGVGAAEAAVAARLGAYGVALSLVVGLLARIGAAGRWRAVGLGLGGLLHVGGIGGWLLLEEPFSLAAAGLAVLVGLWVAGTVPLLATRELGGRRWGLYVELAGVVGLAWTGVLAGIALGPHALDVLDGYVALVVGAYADLLFAGGAAYLLLARGEGIDRALGIAAEGTGEAVAAPPPDADDAGVEPGIGAEAGEGD